MKLTRRALAVTLTATAAALAQTPTPASAEAELQAARDRVRANNLLLGAQQVLMTVEPAFAFKA